MRKLAFIILALSSISWGQSGPNKPLQVTSLPANFDAGFLVYLLPGAVQPPGLYFSVTGASSVPPVSTSWTCMSCAPGSGGGLLVVQNNASTGTVCNELVSADQDGNAIVTPGGSITGVLGIAHSGCGTTGFVSISVSLQDNCLFDSPAPLGPVVGVSAQDGLCTDGIGSGEPIGTLISASAFSGFLPNASCDIIGCNVAINIGQQVQGQANAVVINPGSAINTIIPTAPNVPALIEQCNSASPGSQFIDQKLDTSGLNIAGYKCNGSSIYGPPGSISTWTAHHFTGKGTFPALTGVHNCSTGESCLAMRNPTDSGDIVLFSGTGAPDALKCNAATAGSIYMRNDSVGNVGATEYICDNTVLLWIPVVTVNGLVAGCEDARKYLNPPYDPAPENEDIGLVLKGALTAVSTASAPLGVYCIDYSGVVPSAAGQALYGDLLFGNTDPWQGLTSQGGKNPDLKGGNTPIVTSVQWRSPSGGQVWTGVPVSGTVNTGGNITMMGTALSPCNTTGGCGPHNYPVFTPATGNPSCTTGSNNCRPLSGKFAGSLAPPYQVGHVRIQTSTSTAQCGTSGHGVSNLVVCGADGSPTFTSAMVGGILYYACQDSNNTPIPCVEGATSGFFGTTIDSFVPNGGVIPNSSGDTCSPSSGTGCLIMENKVQGSTDLAASYLIYKVNVPVVYCDGCLGNSNNKASFAHVYRDIGFDTNGVPGGVGYLCPTCQERSEYDDVRFFAQGQQVLNHAAIGATAVWGGGFVNSPQSTHFQTSGAVEFDMNTNDGGASTYAAIVDGWNVVQGKGNGCPTEFTLGTTVAQSGNPFKDGIVIDGCDSGTAPIFHGPHSEFISNDILNVGSIHPVTGATFIGPNMAHGSSAEVGGSGTHAVVEFGVGSLANTVISPTCLNSAPIIIDNNNSTPIVAPCGSTPATRTLPHPYIQGATGYGSYPVPFGTYNSGTIGADVAVGTNTVYTTNGSGSIGGAGDYLVCVHARTVLAGTGSVNPTVQIQWNDGVASKTFTGPTWSLNSTTVTGAYFNCIPVRIGTSATVRVGTTGGTYGTSTYVLSANVEQIGPP